MQQLPRTAFPGPKSVVQALLSQRDVWGIFLSMDLLMAWIAREKQSPLHVQRGHGPSDHGMMEPRPQVSYIADNPGATDKVLRFPIARADSVFV